MDSFERKVLDTINRHSLLKDGEKVVAAVSGGPDSVALLIALGEISGHLDLTVLAAHANHQLRGPESDEDQRFVDNLCKRLQVRLESRRIEIGSSESSRNLEAAARRSRYDFLAEFAYREKAILATGHNMNDQAETFLMKLFRGAGPSGLSGIFIKRHHPLAFDSVPVVRPLLEITRREIIEYLDRKDQKFREDSTNSLLRYDRNWIRHELLPTLQERFTPEIAGTLARNAVLFAEIEEYLDHKAEELVEKIVTECEEKLSIDLRQFGQYPMILRKQLARHAIRRIKGDLLDIGQNHIQAFLHLSSSTSGREIHLPAGLRVVREFNRLHVGRESREVACFEYSFHLPGELYIPEVEKKILARKVSVKENQEKSLLSAQLKKLIVRNRRPGDRYLTSVKSPEKGLKRLFLEKRVPISKRDRLVILESEGRLVWIEGFPANPVTKAGELDAEGFEIEIVNETFGPTQPSK